MPLNRTIAALLVLALAILVGVGHWRIAARQENQRRSVMRNPPGIMGTECTLVAVVSVDEQAIAQRQLGYAEAALRKIEARMSTYLADSEVSRLREASVGREVSLSPETMHVIESAQKAYHQTVETFDITCRPQLELWREAAEFGQTPSSEEMANARAASRWGLLELRQGGIVKHAPTVCVDMGGIAKGYAIDRALEVLRQAGLSGGLVEVGGDLACFGRQANGRLWSVDVKDTRGPGCIARLRVTDCAVATSGDYARFVEIEGTRYSHIIDPRFCRPVDEVAAATVIAPTAELADTWATALSVLGRNGLELLPVGVQALLVIHQGDESCLVATAGLRELFSKPLPARLEFWPGSE